MIMDAFGMLPKVALRHSACTDDLAIIGLSKPANGSNGGDGQHIVFQALRVALGDSAGNRLRRTAIPWSVDDSSFEFWIPNVLAAKLANTSRIRLRSIGWGLEFHTDEPGFPEPDERLDGFAKYTLPLNFDWTSKQKKGFLFLVWDQAGEK